MNYRLKAYGSSLLIHLWILLTILSLSSITFKSMTRPVEIDLSSVDMSKGQTAKTFRKSEEAHRENPSQEEGDQPDNPSPEVAQPFLMTETPTPQEQVSQPDYSQPTEVAFQTPPSETKAHSAPEEPRRVEPSPPLERVSEPDTPLPSPKVEQPPEALPQREKGIDSGQKAEKNIRLSLTKILQASIPKTPFVESPSNSEHELQATQRQLTEMSPHLPPPFPSPPAQRSEVTEPPTRPVATLQKATPPSPQETSSKPAASPEPSPEDSYLKEKMMVISQLVQNNISYPPIARRMGWQGRVVLLVRICKDGSLKELRVAEGSGYEVLDRNAIETVRRVAHLFPKPPVEVLVRLPVTYRLE